MLSDKDVNNKGQCYLFTALSLVLHMYIANDGIAVAYDNYDGYGTAV